MDYYNGSLFISDLEAKLKEKQEKMELLNLIESDNTYNTAIRRSAALPSTHKPYSIYIYKRF